MDMRHPHIPSMDRRGVLRAGTVVQMRPNMYDGPALVVVVVVISHDEPADTVAGAHDAGAAETHFLRVLVQFHGGEDGAEVQLRDIVENG